MKKITLLLLTFVFANTLFAQYDIDDTQNYTFTDISSTGTQISVNDDGAINITAPWDIYLGNVASTQLRVGNNGAILLNDTSSSIGGTNATLTTTNPMIAPFWDDFDTEMGGVYYETKHHYFNGILLYSEFIIQWNRVHFDGSTNTDMASFQVIFRKSTTDSNEVNRTIRFVYADTDMDGTNYDDGLSATIGIATADKISQYSFNTASLTGITTLVFSLPKTNIPDAAFENYLETHNYQGYPRNIGDDDTMGDGIANNNEVYTNRIVNVQDLNLHGLGISDLTGIEDFNALQEFYCNDNQLTGVLDMSANPNVSKLVCDHNDFTRIFTANNDNLSYFDCSDNENLWRISLLGKYHLVTLDISNTTISQIDDNDGDSDYELKFEDNVSLVTLNAAGLNSCHTKTIDLNRQLHLVSLEVSDNCNTDVILPEQQSSLKYLYMNNVSLSESNWVLQIYNLPNSPMLEEFVLNGTDAYTVHSMGGETTGLLDFSNCPNLRLLWINTSTVSTIDLRGTTSNIVAGGFNLTNNKNLHCIYVDDVATAETNWNNYIDYGASFVADETACENRLVYVPDDNFEHYLETHSFYDGSIVSIGASDSMGNGVDNDNYVFAERIEYFGDEGHKLYLINRNIQDLTGIEGFSSLERLQINNNILPSIILNNKWIVELDVNENQLTTLDVTQNLMLESLSCTNNALTTLDVTQNVDLNYLNISNNQFSNIDVTQNGHLWNLNISNNLFSNIDLSQNGHLGNLNISNNQFSNINLTQKVRLYSLNCENNALSTLDLTQNVDLDYLYCQNNALSTLDLTQNVDLNFLYCQNNQIASLDLDTNTELYRVDARYNALTELHIQNGENGILSGVYTNDDGNNISKFRAQANPNLTCIYVDNATDANNGVNDYVSWQKDTTATYVETEAECNALDDNIVLQAKVFLQGPILNPDTAGLMNDNLRNLGYLPMSSPYSDGINYTGDFSTTGNNAIVDYIWVELRDATDNTSIVTSTSAFLQRDGDIVGFDGASNLSFNATADSYYVVIKHRNHLGVMSANPIALSSTAILVDFTDSNFSTYGNHAQVQLANGVMAMWTGDTSNENKIKAAGTDNGAVIIKDFVLADPSNVFNLTTFTSTGYLSIDVDLDGNGKYAGTANDKNILKDNVLNHPSNVFGLSTYTIVGTVPDSSETVNKPINIYLPPSEKVRLENESLINQ